MAKPPIIRGENCVVARRTLRCEIPMLEVLRLLKCVVFHRDECVQVFLDDLF